MALVVHLIDFHQRNSWLENQYNYFQDAGINQGLISLSQRGQIHEQFEARGSRYVNNFDLGIFGLIKASITLKRWAKQDTITIYAHGHIPSIFASFFSTFLGISFIICHHQPNPMLFSHLRKRIYFRAITHSILARYYYMRASLIQVLSVEIQNALLERGFDSNKIVRIPLGLEFEKFFKIDIESRYRSNSDGLVLVSVSRLAWEKRINLGIRTVGHLKNQGLKVKYLIVGAGPELDSLKLLAHELKLSSEVEFLGHREDVNSILNKADVLFHLSLTEAYGQVILEARLTGLPVFTSACGVALDMERSADSYVGIFRSENSIQISRELKAFILNLKSPPKSEITFDSHEFYKMHQYRLVMPEIICKFNQHFDSINHFYR